MIAKAICALILVAAVSGQTTLGTIRGRVLSRLDGEPPTTGVSIECFTEPGASLPLTLADKGGYYSFILLPPGTYRLRVKADSYQSAEVHNLVVPVAGVLDQDFRLRPANDVFEQKSGLLVGESSSIVRFHGPDLDLSRVAFLRAWESGIHIFEPSLSNVIDPSPIRDLPLTGRDAYTMLITQPGVTVDAGTVRSLGLSASGQRPASSNFLLDGLELNNSLIAGPLIAVPTEALDQYRLSIAGYTAEFGRTAGFLANAITRAGTLQWHGLAYHYVRNESLNANDFQNNAKGLARPRQRERQYGYHTGGPVGRSLRVSSAFERLSTAGQEEERDYPVPGPGFLTFLQRIKSGRALELLTTFRPPPSRAIDQEPFAAIARMSKPVTQHRSIGVQRVDWTWREQYRMMARIVTSRFSWPDFIWSPYPDFTSGLQQSTTGAAVAAVAPLPGNAAFEVRLGVHANRFGWDRAHAEIPTLTVSGGNPGARQPLLPGSPAAYSLRNGVRSGELVGNLVLSRRRHIAKAGATLLFRGINDRLPYAEAGRYDFPSLADLANSSRITLFTGLDRMALAAGRFSQPNMNFSYTHRQASVFAQDGIRIGRNAALNAGLRYDNFGSPAYRSNTRAPVFEFGPGSSLADRLIAGRLHDSDLRSQPVFNATRGNLGIRLGLAYNLAGDSSLGSRPVLKAGYGIFFDQAFDNLWLNVRNNAFVFPSTGFEIPDRSNYLLPAKEALQQYRLDRPLTDFPSLTAFDRDLSAGSVHHYFAGIQTRLRRNLVLETNASGAHGRGLISTDTINRQFSLSAGGAARAGCDETRYQSCLPDIASRGRLGWSRYEAFTVQLSSRSARVLFSVAYTLSRSLDNQSDPLRGDFFDLSFAPAVQRPGFSRQFDAQGDRGHSDFDQRHNLVIYSIWTLPAWRRLGWLARDWRVSQVGALRSGFPFSVTDAVSIPSSGGLLLTRRADLSAGKRIQLETRDDVPGGVRLLNLAAFCAPPACMTDRSIPGTSGRNAFRGPGLYNLDASLSRTFLLTRIREGIRMTIRADAFNILNHANLNQPAQDLTSPESFGVALFGRRLRDIGLPSLLPLRETSRQVQLLYRIEF